MLCYAVLVSLTHDNGRVSLLTVLFIFFNCVCVQPGKTLSVRKWQAAFTQEGFLDMGKTLNRIQRGVKSQKKTLFANTNEYLIVSLYTKHHLLAFLTGYLGDPSND